MAEDKSIDAHGVVMQILKVLGTLTEQLGIRIPAITRTQERMTKSGKAS